MLGSYGYQAKGKSYQPHGQIKAASRTIHQLSLTIDITSKTVLKPQANNAPPTETFASLCFNQ
jgi:hypothetical protein